MSATASPRLAGLPAAYLRKQLEAFANGSRPSAVMAPPARILDAEQRAQLAAYYQALPAPTRNAAAPDAPRDERLALHGRWSEEIPACVQCHGANGSGVGAIPALAGQPAAYLATQLRAWKAGDRRGEPLALMQRLAAKLSAADVEGVAQYFAGAPWPQGRPHEPQQESAPAPSGSGAPAAGSATFVPSDRPIPEDDFGKVVRLGRDIFDDPARYAARYVGNDLRCTSCHLDAGRRVGSAPMWAAYVSYPAWRAKNRHVNTFAERLQGCFLYSMNGRTPPLGDPVLVALESYSYWMARGAPVDPNIAGRGYLKLARPALPPDAGRGARVYATSCALCHGENGAGQRANDGSAAFPALWGANSYNWGAGMVSVGYAAGFIKGNMPLSQGNTLSEQEAWDVALFVDSHERPQDPRYTGSVARTRVAFHQGDDSMYGRVVDGHLLGSKSVAPGPRPAPASTGADGR
jgi:thiosulfate dehydrogenase